MDPGTAYLPKQSTLKQFPLKEPGFVNLYHLLEVSSATLSLTDSEIID